MPVSVWFAGGFYLINLLLGMGLQFRLLRLPYRQLHHVLYALVFASCVWAWWEVRHLFLFCASVLWGFLPFTRPGKPSHYLLSGLIGLIYLAFVLHKSRFYS